MTTVDRSSATWRAFAAELAGLSGLSTDAITPELLLIADLHLDSLALTQLVVVALEASANEDFSRRLESYAWDAASAGQVFIDCGLAARSR